MARYVGQVESQLPPERVFNYIADFSTNAEWVPGTESAEQVGDAPVGMGTEFRLVVRVLGLRWRLTYRIVEFERPSVVTFRAENGATVALDRVTIEPRGDEALLTYDATISPKGLMRLANPLLAVALPKVGDRARDRLRDVLAMKTTEGTTSQG
jgi:carbon monoxide dehydrogenase subunit G